MGIKTVEAKLGKMRKAQKFVVYPRKSALDMVLVQSDKAIGRFDPTTGYGVLNAKGSNPKYGQHLMFALGAEAFQFPPEFVKACIEAGVVSQSGVINPMTGEAA